MMRKLGRAVVVAVVGASVFAVACSDTTPPAPRAAITSQIGPGPSSPAIDCNLNTQPVIIMGDPDNSQSVDNGSYGVNSVDCTVAQSGTKYAVAAHLSVKSKGSVTIQGNFQPLDKTKPAPQQANTDPLTVVWVLADTGTFRQTDCTAWYTADLVSPNTNTTLNPYQGVATGRVWATVFCPRATFVGDQTVHKACQAVGEFKLENCATQ
jgi:hypothetical protein